MEQHTKRMQQLRDSLAKGEITPADLPKKTRLQLLKFIRGHGQEPVKTGPWRRPKTTPSSGPSPSIFDTVSRSRKPAGIRRKASEE